MLQFNPDNYKYHQGLRQALNLIPDATGKLSDDQREQLTLLYDGLQNQYSRSSAARRIPLDFKVCLFCQKTASQTGTCICIWSAHVPHDLYSWLSLARSLTHSVTHPLTHSLTHLLVHSSTRSLKMKRFASFNKRARQTMCATWQQCGMNIEVATLQMLVVTASFGHSMFGPPCGAVVHAHFCHPCWQ